MAVVKQKVVKEVEANTFTQLTTEYQFLQKQWQFQHKIWRS